jgi:hypothetical protein
LSIIPSKGHFFELLVKNANTPMQDNVLTSYLGTKPEAPESSGLEGDVIPPLTGFLILAS